MVTPKLQQLRRTNSIATKTAPLSNQQVRHLDASSRPVSVLRMQTRYVYTGVTV